MRSLSTEAIAALDSGRFGVRCLLKVSHDSGPFCIWDDIGTVSLDGDTYLGAPGRFRVSPVSSSSDLSARGVEVTLSAQDLPTAAMIESAGWHQRPILITRAIFAIDAPQIIHALPVFAGYLDQMIRRDTLNGASAMVFKCESASREIKLRGTRTRSDTDQRTRDTSDGFFRHCVNAVQLSIDWGGAPAAGHVVHH